MKVFVINLDKNKERMKSMDAQLKKLGIEYERISAIYGKEMPPEVRKRDFSKVRSFLASGVRLRDGEIGCALSHCKIYKEMDAKEINAAVILEDDVVVTDEMPNVLSQIRMFLDCEKAQVFLLSSFGEKKHKENGIERIKDGMCADGYVITLPAAKCIYKANYPIITVADRWSRWVKRFNIELYRVWPTVVCQDNDRFGTDIAIVKSISFKGISKLIYKATRVVELSIDWLLFKLYRR